MGNEETSVVSASFENAKGYWGQIKQYVSEVKTETKRVTWPSLQEVYGTTIMVVLTTFIFGIYFYVCDQAFGHSVTALLNFLRHRG